MGQCKLLADAVVESSSLLEFSLAANETTPDMLSRHLKPVHVGAPIFTGFHWTLNTDILFFFQLQAGDSLGKASWIQIYN